MIIDVFSDIHTIKYPSLPGGDLLIFAGDLAGIDQAWEYEQFFEWMIEDLAYEAKIFVAGNHDTMIEKRIIQVPDEITYLENGSTTFNGLEIWGTPLSLWFHGINPKCQAFTGSEIDLFNAFQRIPKDIDILVSHGPAKGILDNGFGSHALLDALDRVQPKVLITAHIHEAYGELLYKHQGLNTKCINASIVDRAYKAKNIPIRLEI